MIIINIYNNSYLQTWFLYITCALCFTKQILTCMFQPHNFKNHFRWGSRSKFTWTNLDPFEANWILELDLALFGFWFFKWWTFFLGLFFGPHQLIFPPKEVPCRFSFNLPPFSLGPSSKALGSNWKLSTNKIILFCWTLIKMTLNFYKCF
jgi:hypothetical protein